jgi:hypothetical protein
MDWGMMQDPYKVAQTACRMGYNPVPTVDNGNTNNMSSSSSNNNNTNPNNNNNIVHINDMNGNNINNNLSSSSSKTNRGHFHHNHPLSTQHHHYHCHHVCLRPRLRFGLTLSALIVVADALLRFSWTLRFLARFPSNDAYVLCTQFLEIFRRAIWNLLRVEWENIKQKQKQVKSRDSWSDHRKSSFSSPSSKSSVSVAQFRRPYSTNSNNNNNNGSNKIHPHIRNSSKESVDEYFGDMDDGTIPLVDTMLHSTNTGGAKGGSLEMKSLL